MSVCILTKVGEGLVFASDSATTLSGSPVIPGGQPGPQGVVKIFLNSTKIFQVSNLPVGILTWGAGTFKTRTVASLVEEFENLDQIKKIERKNLDVNKVSNELWEFMAKKSEDLFKEIPEKGRPRTGILIGGYSKENFFPEEYQMLIPVQKPQRVRPNIEGKPNFGTNWFGITDAIIRFHHGRDDRIFDILEKNGIEKEKIDQIRDIINREIQYHIPFDGMPLGDAIEYAKFLVQLTISRFRFVIGAELCGGPIDLATITRKNGFSWIANKKIQYIKS